MAAIQVVMLLSCCVLVDNSTIKTTCVVPAATTAPFGADTIATIPNLRPDTTVMIARMPPLMLLQSCSRQHFWWSLYASKLPVSTALIRSLALVVAIPAQ